MKIFYLIILITVLSSVKAWDSEQLEVFDAVDEVKHNNFYELLNITKVSLRNRFYTPTYSIHSFRRNSFFIIYLHLFNT